MKGLGEKTAQTYFVDLTGVAVCALLAVIGYVTALRPLLQRRASLEARGARLGAQRRDAERLTDSVKVLAERLEQVRGALADCPVRLEAAYHCNRRIARIGNLVTQSGMKIEEIHPGTVRTTARYKTVPIRLVATGTFPACVTLLGRLRQALPDTAVTSFALSGNPRKPGAPGRLEISLIWYAAGTNGSDVTKPARPQRLARRPNVCPTSL